MSSHDPQSPHKLAPFLTREEVIRRRSQRAKNLRKRYRDVYWELVEEIRAKHREYYWTHGVSPFNREERGGDQEEDANKNNEKEGFGERGDDKKKIRVRSECGFGGCKLKAMPLTRFCNLHILADRKQTLYKGCIFVSKSAQNGPLVCGKPILRAAMPSLCPAHFLKAQKNLSQSLKKAGINLRSTSRPTAEFNVILLEVVRKIQGERKKALTKRSKDMSTSIDNTTNVKRV